MRQPATWPAFRLDGGGLGGLLGGLEFGEIVGGRQLGFESLSGGLVGSSDSKALSGGLVGSSDSKASSGGLVGSSELIA